jgi:hypothetical protein
MSSVCFVNFGVLNNMKDTALGDLDFGPLFSDSVSTAAKTTTLVPGVAESVYSEAFNAVCTASKIDPTKVIVKDLTKSQRGDLFREVVLIGLRRGHSKKNIFAILGRAGILQDAQKMKIWNSAKKRETYRLFSSAFACDAWAVDPKSAVPWLLDGKHDGFVHTTAKGKKTNLLAAIGFIPYMDLLKRVQAFKTRKPEESAEYKAEFDEIKQDRVDLTKGVNELVGEVNTAIKSLFSSKDRVSRTTDDFPCDDRLLAAMTTGGVVIDGTEFEDDDEDSITE